MKKGSLRLLALLLSAFMTLGCLALAEDAPEAAEVVEVVEAPFEEAPEAEPEVEEAPEAEPVDEAAAEQPEIPAEEGKEAPAEVPAEKEPAPEEPEAAPKEPVEAEEEPEEPEEAPDEPEEAPEEEENAEEAPAEEGEAADEGEEIAEEAEFAYPEGLQVSSDGKTVTGYTGSATTLTIPDGITTIGDAVFKGNTTLTEVTLPTTLKRIGEEAFYSCTALEGIDIPSGAVSIGKDAFAYSAIKYAMLPNTLTSMGNGAFRECKGLTSITVPGSLKAIPEAAFAWCTKLYALTLEEGIESFGESAFCGCLALTRLRIPASVKEIGETLLVYSSYIMEIEVASGSTYFEVKDGCLIRKNDATLMFCTRNGRTQLNVPAGVKRIDYRACFSNGLKEITLPSGLQEIEGGAFESCGITSITIPDSVTYMGEDIFNYCTEMKEIKLSNKLTFLSSYLLSNCTGLTEVVVPNSVKEIKNKVFYKCTGLKKVTIPAGVTMISDNAFEGCGTVTIRGYAGSYAETYANEKGMPFEELNLPAVTSASADKTTTPAKQAVTFTVKTPKAANYLTMYAESGAAAKTWPASGNSSVSGSTRTWTVQYAISTAGSRTLTFKASTDGANYGEGKSVSITVTAALLNVTSATAAETTVAAKAPVTFTVKTPKDAKFLAMFAESGSKVKVWGCTNYSKVSGSTRVWTVSYAIANKGTRHLTFKCAKSTTYGEGKTVDLKVVAEQPAVTSASANKSTVAAKETVTFTVKTPAAAKFVALYTESGTKVKVWGMSGNSTVSGDVRTWTIKYAIASKGDRKLTFRASTNGVYGAGKTVSVKVQ